MEIWNETTSPIGPTAGIGRTCWGRSYARLFRAVIHQESHPGFAHAKSGDWIQARAQPFVAKVSTFLNTSDYVI